MNPNVQAFLAVIRACEGTDGPNGYRMLFGGKLFTGFADHPRQVVTLPSKTFGTISSSAAGAYQILARTWDRLGGGPFDPSSQDAACVKLIDGRGALADVVAGRLGAALAKCCKEWASLPGAPYGQPVKSLAFVRDTFRRAGGLEA